MKTVSTIQFRRTRPAKSVILVVLGSSPFEIDEYFFICWTDEGKSRQEEALQAPEACGYSMRDMTAIPETKGVPKNLLKTTIIGSDSLHIQTVRSYLLDHGWRMEEFALQPEALSATSTPQPATAERGRGTKILVLGILSVLGLGIIFGVPAWMMAYTDLKKIKEGKIPQTERCKTRVGSVLGIIGTLLSVLAAPFLLALVGIYND